MSGDQRASVPSLEELPAQEELGTAGESLAVFPESGRKGWVKRVSATEGSDTEGVGWLGGTWGTRADKAGVSQFSHLSSRHTGIHTCRVHLLFCYLLSFLSLRTNCALRECEHPRTGSPRAASVNVVLF